MKQIYFEDIEIDDMLPELKKHPTPRQEVMWAGASGDFYEIHYSETFAKEIGLPGIIVHGMLTMSFLCQLLTDWVGIEGEVKKIGTSNRSMLYPGHDMFCKGKVTGKYSKDNQNFVECELWAENDKGEKCVTAKALITLPSRNDK